MPDRSAGESTYLPQVLESLHDTIKDALPRNIRNLQPSTAIRKLSAALVAVSKSRNWIQVAYGQKVADKWEYTDRLEQEHAPQTYLAGTFSPRYVGGPRLLIEDLLTEDDEQLAKLTLDSLTETGLGAQGNRLRSASPVKFGVKSGEVQVLLVAGWLLVGL